jgi:hypothetical protein
MHPRPRATWSVACLFVMAGLAFGARSAYADEPKASAWTHCRIPEGGSPALGEASPGARLAFVQRTLDDQASRARLWTATWSAGYTAIAGASVAFAAASSDRDKRIEWLVSGLPAVAVPLLFAIDPLKVMRDQGELERLVRETRSVEGAMDPCIVLAEGEWLLMRDADDEREKVAPLNHVLNIVGSVVVGLAVGLSVGDWVGAALNAAGGTALGELAFWTEPTGAVDALRRYRAGRLDDVARAPALRFAGGLGVAF